MIVLPYPDAVIPDPCVEVITACRSQTPRVIEKPVFIRCPEAYCGVNVAIEIETRAVVAVVGKLEHVAFQFFAVNIRHELAQRFFAVPEEQDAFPA